MPLAPYQSSYRPTTPPYTELPNPGYHSRNASGSSTWSVHSSPNSVATRATTPSRSPARQLGPQLLPKIRTQDQSLELSSKEGRSHRRALSTTYNPPGQASISRPRVQRSTTSPPECVSLISPVSATSTQDWVNSAQNSPLPFSNSNPPTSRRHARASSTDPSALRQYCYPYNSVPTYTTRAPQYTPSVIAGSSTFIQPPVNLPVQRTPYALAEELQFTTEDDPSITLSAYLSARGPPIHPVPCNLINSRRGLTTHCWWDVRNLRTWSSFTLSTIRSIPGFPELLSVPLPAAGLPFPSIPQSRLQPQSETQLLEISRDFYATKLNAALKASMGQVSHLSMRADKLRPADGPHFISSYANENTQTLFGNGRGRVVGLVKSFDRWNTGMRHQLGQPKVEYLQGLSHLQRCMREHGTRYGFLLTEIELVCVRMGTESVPYFGLLELAPTIATATDAGLTAGMALWYLHMLARNAPCHGEAGWQVDVGPPCALSRQKVWPEGVDPWIPRPGVSESRNAKTARGWVMPADAYCKKKEGGGGNRAACR